jgi:hypothetical protein
MKIKSIVLLCVIIGTSILVVAGCTGDSQPTNTKNSQYIGSGDTAADKIGLQRKKARLPHGGDAATQ